MHYNSCCIELLMILKEELLAVLAYSSARLKRFQSIFANKELYTCIGSPNALKL